MARFNLILSLFLSVMFISDLAWALQAITVKGQRVLFALAPSETSIAANTVVISTDKSVQVKIVQVKGVRALGDTIKGVPKPQMTFRKLSSEKQFKSLYGFFVGASINTMTITVNSATTLNLAGTGYSLLGFADFPLVSSFTFRGLTGYESFKAAVASTVCPSGTCSVELNYLTAQGFAQYDLANNTRGSRYWIGLGLGGLFLASASSEIINTDKMKTNQLFILGSGLDYRLTNGALMPIQLDYYLYPEGDIKTQQFNIRLGYGF